MELTQNRTPPCLLCWHQGRSKYTQNFCLKVLTKTLLPWTLDFSLYFQETIFKSNFATAKCYAIVSRRQYACHSLWGLGDGTKEIISPLLTAVFGSQLSKSLAHSDFSKVFLSLKINRVYFYNIKIESYVYTPKEKKNSPAFIYAEETCSSTASF